MKKSSKKEKKVSNPYYVELITPKGEVIKVRVSKAVFEKLVTYE